MPKPRVISAGLYSCRKSIPKRRDRAEMSTRSGLYGDKDEEAFSFRLCGEALSAYAAKLFLFSSGRRAAGVAGALGSGTAGALSLGNGLQ